MGYCFPLCVSVAFVVNHSDRCLENGMTRPKLEGSFPAGYKFGKRSGTWTKLNGLVNPFSNRRTAGVLTVVRIMAGTANHAGAGRGVAISPSKTQCHPWYT